MKDTKFLVDNGVDLEGSLSLLEDMETFDDTLPNFRSSLVENINNLKAYLIAANTSSYAIDVHSIKSNAMFFGFTKLAEMALNHEQSSKAGNIDYLKEHFNELYNEVIKSINVIDKYMASEESKPAKKRILIADDSEVVIVLAKKILENDYDITSASNGEEVITILSSDTNFDAMLLDLNMPKVDGYGVLAYMSDNKLFDKIPVSIISGNDEQDSIKRAFSYPIVDMLIKPFNNESMNSILNKTLSRKNSTN